MALKQGSKGDQVQTLQNKLNELGYKVDADGHFGPLTDKVVRDLQGLFGYDVDGIVGDGTLGLIDAQIGYGWSASAPDAKERALRAQGKTAEADVLKQKREKAAQASKAKG